MNIIYGEELFVIQGIIGNWRSMVMVQKVKKKDEEIFDH